MGYFTADPTIFGALRHFLAIFRLLVLSCIICIFSSYLGFFVLFGLFALFGLSALYGQIRIFLMIFVLFS